MDIHAEHESVALSVNIWTERCSQSTHSTSQIMTQENDASFD